MVRVFVVDDHASMRSLVCSLAEELGYEIAGEAADGRRAVTGIAEQEPDIVVMDWQMPLMDGVEATTIVKRATPGIDVIAYTSTDDADVRERFLAAGACDHVTKGDVDGLLSAMERCGAAHERS